jgi:transcription factor TFIIIB component B''
MVGCDFSLMSKFFPGRNRRQGAAKFRVEERKDPDLLRRAMANAKPLDVGEYAKVVGIDVEEIKAEYELNKGKLSQFMPEHSSGLDSALMAPAASDVAFVGDDDDFTDVASGDDEVTGVDF